MLCGRRCAGTPSKPSGHSAECLHYSGFPSEPAANGTLKRSNPLNFPDDYHGPFRDFDPPGDRTPAVGERQWGDDPYLPSYQDPMYQEPRNEAIQPSLFFRGPFYQGASETHEEFSYPGRVSPRKFSEYVRHYEEPGMRNNQSITQTDFGPLPQWSKRNQSRNDQYKSDYTPKLKPLNNIHEKVPDPRSVSEPELIYVEKPPPKSCFNTENSDNYVCYQMPKTEKRLVNVKPPKGEEFMKRVRKTHKDCPYGPYEIFEDDCNDYECETSKPKDVHERTQRNPWFLYPRKQPFANECMTLSRQN